MLAFLAAAFLAPPRTIILTYHDMVDRRDAKALWFDCTVEELAEQLDWLKDRGANFVSLKDIEDARMGGKQLPAKAVAITFADNYAGFKRLAWPILLERQVPVAMFAHTGHVGSQKGRPKMTWDDLKELSESPLFTLASQTVSHPADLTKLTDAQIEKEFEASKATLSQHGFEAAYLAYPNGKYDGRVADIARRAGYRLAFTEAMKPMEQAPDNWRIPRWVHTKFREAWR